MFPENLETWKVTQETSTEILSFIKTVRKVAKIVFRITFFRTLEINQRLTAIQEVFTQKKKLLNLCKNELCGILICLSPIPGSLSPH